MKRRRVRQKRKAWKRSQTLASMNLPRAADRSAAARARMARLRGLEDSESDLAAANAAAAGSRKELLPDVEEINSSIVASQDRSPVDEGTILEAEIEQPVVKRRRGSRLAFRLIIIFILLALAVYVFAPQIVEAVPQTEPYLATYIDWINGIRDQIDPLIAQGVDLVKGLIGGDTAAE